MTPGQLALKLRDRGQADAAEHIGEREMDVLRKWIVGIADRAGDDGFTADDVKATLPPWVAMKLQQVPNALGAAWRQVAKQRLIERAPDKAPRPANDKQARGRMLPVWRRLQTDPRP